MSSGRRHCCIQRSLAIAVCLFVLTASCGVFDEENFESASLTPIERAGEACDSQAFSTLREAGEVERVGADAVWQSVAVGLSASRAAGSASCIEILNTMWDSGLRFDVDEKPDGTTLLENVVEHNWFGDVFVWFVDHGSDPCAELTQSLKDLRDVSSLAALGELSQSPPMRAVVRDEIADRCDVETE